MSKPSPDDYQKYLRWLESQPADAGKEAKPQDSIDEEFRRVFNSEEMQSGLQKAVEMEKFVEEHGVESDAQLAAYKAAEEIKVKKIFFQQMIELIQFIILQAQMPVNTKLESLYRYIGLEAQKIHESGKTDFTKGEKRTIALFSLLVELKEEGFSEELTLPDVIKVIKTKLKALNEIELE